MASLNSVRDFPEFLCEGSLDDDLTLGLAANLFAFHLQEIGDEIVSEGWKLSDAIVKINDSNLVVGVFIEITAFLLHVFSRNLPIIQGDCLNEFGYSPVVIHCARGVANLVEYVQDKGGFNEAVFSGNAIEVETLKTVDMRDQEYAVCSMDRVADHAAKVITERVGKNQLDLSFAISQNLILATLIKLDFSAKSQHLQKGLTPSLRAFLGKMQ